MNGSLIQKYNLNITYTEIAINLEPYDGFSIQFINRFNN